MLILLHFFKTVGYYIHTATFKLPCGGYILHISFVWVVYFSVPSASSTEIRTISNVHENSCNVVFTHQYTVLVNDDVLQTFVSFNDGRKQTFLWETPLFLVCATARRKSDNAVKSHWIRELPHLPE